MELQTILTAAPMELKTHNVQSSVTKFKHNLQSDLNQQRKHQDHSQLKDHNLSLHRDLNLSQQILHNLVLLNNLNLALLNNHSHVQHLSLNLVQLSVHINQIQMSMFKMKPSLFHLHALPL
jgi:hypothetical protein